MTDNVTIGISDSTMYRVGDRVEIVKTVYPRLLMRIWQWLPRGLRSAYFRLLVRPFGKETAEVFTVEAVSSERSQEG